MLSGVKRRSLNGSAVLFSHVRLRRLRPIVAGARFRSKAIRLAVGILVDRFHGSTNVEDMLNRLGQLFTKSKLSEEERNFVTQLAASRIWVLAVGLRGAPPVSADANDPENFSIIAAHRIDVSEVGEDDSVFPYNYYADDRQILPFFTTEERAKEFAAKAFAPEELNIFQPCDLLAGFVATPENETFRLVLDPGSPAERIISHDQRMLLRSLTAKR